MATLMAIESLQTEYRGVLDSILENAVVNEPRGKKVYDAGYTMLQICQPMMPQLPVHTGRGVSLKIAAIEALQLVSGRDLGDIVLKIAPQFREYTNVIGNGDDGNPFRRVFHGNYGARMGVNFNHSCDTMNWHQSWIECVAYKIMNDHDTRQAAINIWDNDLDNGLAGKNDYPCTIALGFRLYRGMLDMFVTMRSNDAWKGLPYDVFQFNQAHHTLGNILGVPLGQYYHTAWSMHIYEEDVKRVESVKDRELLSPMILPRGFKNVDAAGDIARGVAVGEYDEPSHRWYHDQVNGFIEEKNG